jgi:hypothetical protein
LSDGVQDGRTDFDKTGKFGSDYDYKDYNGNGGIPVLVKEYLGFTDVDLNSFPDNAARNNKGFPDGRGSANSNDLIIYGGQFRGPVNSKNVKITFTLSGYSRPETATVYYCITDANAYNANNLPPYNMFTQVFESSFFPGVNSDVPLILPEAGNRDIWLTFRMADGRVSNRIVINTSTYSGSMTVPW